MLRYTDMLLVPAVYSGFEIKTKHLILFLEKNMLLTIRYSLEIITVGGGGNFGFCAGQIWALLPYPSPPPY